MKKSRDAERLCSKCRSTLMCLPLGNERFFCDLVHCNKCKAIFYAEYHGWKKVRVACEGKAEAVRYFAYDCPNCKRREYGKRREKEAEQRSAASSS